MKKFDTPRMERINLVKQNIMVTSLCPSKYCCGYTCPQCKDDGTICYDQSPCNEFNCNPLLCTNYSGTGC